MRAHLKQLRSALRLEQLESRDAPATLVGANKVTYQDIDGDSVTVTLSKPLLTAANVNSVFDFDASTVDGSNAAKQQLEMIDLGPLGQAAEGLGITLTAVRSQANGGDGFAALGHIDSILKDLGVIVIDGDLGRIRAGDGAFPATTGVTSLTVHSMGRYSTTTGAPNLTSSVGGKLGSLVVKSDIRTASILAVHVGSVTIGGSLIGSAAADTGRINAVHNIGPVKIGGDIVGGSGTGSGGIRVAGTLAGVTIGGSLRGGNGDQSGVLFSTGAVGALKITGNVVGGDGQESGNVSTGGPLASAQIGGSVLGGGGDFSGSIFATNGLLGPVNIVGDLVGGNGLQSGRIGSNGSVANVTIGGSLLGGGGNSSGLLHSQGSMGAVKVKGDVSGGGDVGSGQIIATGTLASATIGGALRGGDSLFSGTIRSTVVGPVKVIGDVVGGVGDGSGSIRSSTTIVGATIGGSMRGGAGADSGQIFSTGALDTVKITGDVIGGSGPDSGQIDADISLASVAVGGSLRGGSGHYSGRIFTNGAIGVLKITGDLVGGSASGTDNLVESGYVQAGRIASLTLGGSLIAGIDNTTGNFLNNGAIRVVYDLGPVLIKGSVIGNVTNPAVISARGSATPTATSDIAIASLTVQGRMEFGRIVAGEGANGLPRNADAQIGAVKVGGNWFASSIAAGAVAGASGFGSGDTKMAGAGVKDEATLSSRIASISIGGQALGTVGGSTHFGIVAENVGAVKVGGTPFVLTAGNSNDDFVVGITDDFRVNEV